jgi:hypothetical protein
MELITQVVAEHDIARRRGDGGGFPHDLLFLGLRIKGIEVAHAAGHVEVDDMFGFRARSSAFGCGFGKLGAHHGKKMDTEQGARGVGEKAAAGDFVGIGEIVHGLGFVEVY